MKKQLFLIKRQRKYDNEVHYLSLRMRRWLPTNSRHKYARVAEEIADRFIEKMKGTPEEKVYYYFKVMVL